MQRVIVIHHSDFARYDSGPVAFLIDRVESAVQKRSNFSNVVNVASQKVELKGDDDREEGEVEVVKTCYLLLKGSYLRKESRRPKLYVCHCRLPSLIPSLLGNNLDCNFCMLTQQKVVKPCRISSLHVKSNLEKTDYY